MVQAVDDGLERALEPGEVEHVGVLVERALERGRHPVVVAVERLALVPVVGDEVPGAEHRVVLLDPHPELRSSPRRRGLGASRSHDEERGGDEVRRGSGVEAVAARAGGRGRAAARRRGPSGLDAARPHHRRARAATAAAAAAPALRAISVSGTRAISSRWACAMASSRPRPRPSARRRRARARSNVTAKPRTYSAATVSRRAARRMASRRVIAGARTTAASSLRPSPPGRASRIAR